MRPLSNTFCPVYHHRDLQLPTDLHTFIKSCNSCATRVKLKFNTLQRPSVLIWTPRPGTTKKRPRFEKIETNVYVSGRFVKLRFEQPPRLLCQFRHFEDWRNAEHRGTLKPMCTWNWIEIYYFARNDQCYSNSTRFAVSRPENTLALLDAS